MSIGKGVNIFVCICKFEFWVVGDQEVGVLLYDIVIKFYIKCEVGIVVLVGMIIDQCFSICFCEGDFIFVIVVIFFWCGFGGRCLVVGLFIIYYVCIVVQVDIKVIIQFIRQLQVINDVVVVEVVGIFIGNKLGIVYLKVFYIVLLYVFEARFLVVVQVVNSYLLWVLELVVYYGRRFIVVGVWYIIRVGVYVYSIQVYIEVVVKELMANVCLKCIMLQVGIRYDFMIRGVCVGKLEIVIF